VVDSKWSIIKDHHCYFKKGINQMINFILYSEVLLVYLEQRNLILSNNRHHNKLNQLNQYNNF